MERAQHLAAVLRHGVHVEHIFPVHPHGQAHRNLPAAGLRLEDLLERGADIAVQGHPLPEVGHILAADLQAFADIAPEAGHPVGGRDRETVAVVQLQPAMQGLDAELHPLPGRPADALHRPHGLAHRLGRVHRGPLAPLSVQEKFGIAAIEGLGGVGHETARHLAPGGAAVALGILLHQRVQRQGIVPNHILHIGGVLQAALHLEGAHTRIGQLLQPGLQVEILERQERLAAHQHVALPVHQVVEGAAGLDALAAVRAPAVDVLGQAAFAAIAHAERPVHEALHLAGDGGADLTDLRQRELPLENDAFAAQRLEVPGTLRIADGALGGGMDGHGDVLPGSDPGLPDDERVRARFLGPEHLRMCFLLLAFAP